jgi:primosomal protein N''
MMRDRQIHIIDNKFKELYSKLEERKAYLTKELTHKFDTNLFKVNDKLRACKDTAEDVTSI